MKVEVAGERYLTMFRLAMRVTLGRHAYLGVIRTQPQRRNPQTSSTLPSAMPSAEPGA